MTYKKGDTATHGMSRTAEYKTWSGMIQRCTNPNKTEYRFYGGRGIKICDEWRTDFMAFYKFVGPKPAPDYSLDRIDPDGNYEPGNVRWATPFEQRTNVKYRSWTFNGYQHRASETAEYPERNSIDGLIYTLLGAAGEGGELANLGKKIIRDNKWEVTAEVKAKLIKEAGDVLWYLSQLAEELGVSFESLARVNIEKLTSRKERGVITGSGDNR